MARAVPLVLCLSLIILTADPAGPLAAGVDLDPLGASQGAGVGGGKIAAELEAELTSLPAGDMLTVIVTLAEQADLSQIPGTDRAPRLEGTIRALQALATASQRRIQPLLGTRAAQGLVGEVVSFWVFNGFAVTATGEMIRELAARSDVARITPDEISVVPSHVGGVPGLNLSIINAPDLWDLGLSGQGAVVANMDTGVHASHPDLSGHWRGGLNSWFDPYGEHPETPYDPTGHGTWTMGVMVAGDDSGQSIGVAPGAQWIAVKIFDDRGRATATAIHQGFEWLLDPDGDPTTPDAPHVVNNSWTFAYPGCNLEFELDLRSLLAAGILPVFAAGNAGPDAGTSFSPANNPSAFAVGATDDRDGIASFSSRGPSSCGGPKIIFPDLTAPGVEIHTADLFGHYTDATGASMAAPHVAGGLALLLSAYPDLPVAQQQQALTDTAVDLGAPGPDNDFGHGRLDLLAAYEWLHDTVGPRPGSDRADLSVVKVDARDPVGVRDTIVYTVTVNNAGPDAASGVTVWDLLPFGVSEAAASGDGWTCAHGPLDVTCTRPALTVGPAPSIVITVTAPSSSAVITNTVTVTSTAADPFPADNRDIETTSIRAWISHTIYLPLIGH